MDSSFDLGTLLKKYKPKSKHISNMAEGIQRRLTTVLKNHKSTRLSVFDRARNLPACPSPPPKNKMQQRLQQLQKWKEEKEKKKKEEAAKKKKPFVTGVAHAPLSYAPLPPPKVMPSTSGRVTRSQARNIASQAVTKQPSVKNSVKSFSSFAPNNAGFQPKIDLPHYVFNNRRRERSNYVSFDPVVPTTNKTKPEKKVNNKKKDAEKYTEDKNSVQKNKGNSSIKENNTLKPAAKVPVKKSTKSTPKKNLPNPTVVTTPKNTVPKSESSSEEKLRSPQAIESSDDQNMSQEEIMEQALKISPCVTISRGKDNARKELKQKLDDGLLDEDSCDVDNVVHFRKQLKSEIDRLTELCNTWDEIIEQTQLPEHVHELVLSAVGLARLLMSQKLQQFGGLVERCARPEPGHAAVTCADLAGFWDMVFMQVQNVDMRFKKLEEYKARGWADEEPMEKAPKVVKPAAKRVAKPATGPSRLREMIAAARKAKKQEVVESPVKDDVPADSKSFEGGFFSVRSPVRSPVSHTPTKNNLLKAVLSSEAKKSATKNCTSFAMLRASLLAKNVEIDGVAPLEQTPVKLTPINLNATPARSILKSGTKTKSTGKKSIKFSYSDEKESPQEEKDSGVSSLDIEEKENKTPKLVRQLALDEGTPMVTRSRRKTIQVPKESDVEVQVVTPRRSRRQRVLQEADQREIETPVRSSRRRSRKSVA